MFFLGGENILEMNGSRKIILRVENQDAQHAETNRREQKKEKKRDKEKKRNRVLLNDN